MGLIKAAVGAASGVMADQWKEFFYCESMPKEVLVTKGVKRTSGRSSNTRGSDNIITSGSGIAVADGQCMMIVEQGRVVELCAEPGEFTYDASSEPSVFSGSLSAGIKNTFAQIGKRFTYGGDAGKDQRVYYFNTKELIDNKFGTPNPFRSVWSITRSGWMWTFPSAAPAYIRTALRTRFCSTRMCAAMWSRNIPATNWTAS